MMKLNWKHGLAGLVLVIAGFVTGQYQLVVNGMTIAGNSMIVTPAPATVIVPADSKTIQEVILENKESKE